MPTSGPEDRRRAEHIETLLQQVSAIPDGGVRTQVEELVRSLLELYGDGLARMLALTDQSAEGGALIEAFADDELVGSLLLLHGLHPLDVETRVTRAVEGVRPTIAKHGGTIELVGVDDGIAQVRWREVGLGCSSPAKTVRSIIEDALYAAAPELEGVRIDGLTPPPGHLIQLTPSRRSARTTPSAEHVPS